MVPGDVGGADRDDAGAGRRVVRGRGDGHALVAVVAGGGDDHHVLAGGVIHGVLERVAGAGPAQRQVDHGGAVVDGVLDAPGDVEIVGRTYGIQHLDGHDAALPGGAHHAQAVVAGGAGDTGHQRAVAHVVVGRGVVVDEVPAPAVVGVAVAVVVDQVAAHLAGVGPDPADEVGVVQLDAAVDDGQHHGVVPRGGVPGVREAHGLEVALLGRAADADRAAAGVGGVVGHGGGVADPVRFDHVDDRGSGQGGLHGRGRGVTRRHPHESGGADDVFDGAAGGGHRPLDGPGGRGVVEADQEPVGRAVHRRGGGPGRAGERQPRRHGRHSQTRDEAPPQPRPPSRSAVDPPNHVR